MLTQEESRAGAGAPGVASGAGGALDDDRGRRSPERGDPLPTGEEGDLARWILRACPPPHGPLVALIQQVSSGLLPSAAGWSKLDLGRPSALYASRLAGSGVVGWRPDVLEDHPAPVRLVYLGREAFPDGAVRIESGEPMIRVNLAVFPPDGRWHFFGLADRDIFETTDREREVFALCKDLEAADGPTVEPARLLLGGYLAQAWAAACASGWADDALRGLLLLLFPRMDRLIVEASSGGPRGDGFDGLRGDLGAARRRIAALQQSLIEGLSS